MARGELKLEASMAKNGLGRLISILAQRHISRLLTHLSDPSHTTESRFSHYQVHS
jgi:hypothetical protein